MKRFLTIASIISIMLFSFGSAHAIQGVADDVPGVDTVIPFLCEKNGTLNTVWAIAEVLGLPASASLFVYNSRSEFVYDDAGSWTPFDILPGDCQTLLAGMSTVQQTMLEKTIDGKVYYAGYLLYLNNVLTDQFVNWVYLLDLSKGFASGFNGYSVEGGVDFAPGNVTALLEGGVNALTASSLFPRYFVLNNKAESFNWWILLKGINGAAHTLDGAICNEEEDCISLLIPVPDELNVINVNGYIPAILHAGYAKAGMGLFDTNFAAATTLAWSYQRAQSDALSATWDVIHPVHRLPLPVGP